MRLNRLIIIELLPMWFFGTMMFTVLVLSGTFLSELTALLSEGVAPGQVAMLAIDLVPSTLATSLPMGTLLGVLLAFGRLSGESEIVALRAAGASVERMMVPVGAFGLTVALCTFLINDFLVPIAARDGVTRRAAIEQQLGKRRKQSVSEVIRDSNDKVAGYLVAGDIDLIQRALKDVVLVGVDSNGVATSVLTSPRLTYTNQEDWQIGAGAKIYGLIDKSEITLHEGAWPSSISRPKNSLNDFLSRTLSDASLLPMAELQRSIQKLEKEKTPDLKRIRNNQFLYWNKIAIPLSAFVFALLGAPLGIRNHRTGAAVGFAVSIGIIFAYVMLANSMNAFNLGGKIPAYVASFTPVALGLIAAGILVHKRNVQ